MQRRPKEERWNKELLHNFLATPWCKPVPPEDHRAPEVLPPREEPLSRPAPEGPDPREGPKQVYIRDLVLERYGYTVGCRRCGLMREGRPARGIRHALACRARVEEAMRAAGDARLQQARQRQDEELARRIEAADGRLDVPRERSAATGHNREVGDGALHQPSQLVEEPRASLEEELLPRAEVGEGGGMRVEEEVVGDMVESVLMAPGLFALRDRLQRPLPLRMHRAATRLYDLLSTTGVSPGGAQAKVAELYSRRVFRWS